MFDIISATGKQLLWPPNHNLVDVQHSLRIEADCEQSKDSQSLWKTGVEVWSNEPELDKVLASLDSADKPSASSNKKAKAKKKKSKKSKKKAKKKSKKSKKQSKQSTAQQASSAANNSNGSGNFAPDAKQANDKLRLRAERSGNGNGRVYLLINLGVSSDDNVALHCSAVVVPHSNSQQSIDAVNAMAKDAVKYCEDNQGLAPAGWYQHGLSEEVGPKQ